MSCSAVIAGNIYLKSMEDLSEVFKTSAKQYFSVEGFSISRHVAFSFCRYSVYLECSDTVGNVAISLEEWLTTFEEHDVEHDLDVHIRLVKFR